MEFKEALRKCDNVPVTDRMTGKLIPAQFRVGNLTNTNATTEPPKLKG